MRDTRLTVGRALAGVAALGYVLTAWLHSTGYDSVTALAAQGPADLSTLMPALWLVFAVDLAVLGLIIGIAAWRPEGPARLIIGIAALGPFGAAALQLRFLGFIPPTAILIVIGVLATAAALVLPGRHARA